MPKAPSFQFYPKDFLSDYDAMAMPSDARGIYIVLLCYDWINDGITKHDGQWLKLGGYIENPCHECGGGEDQVEDLLEWLRPLFVTHPTKEGYVTNPRLQSEREKQTKYRAKQHQNAMKRWHGSGISDGNATALPNACSSSSTPVYNKKNKTTFTPPSLATVQAYTTEQGLRVDAGAFVDFYTSKGWKVGTSPMKDWQAALRNWARRTPKERHGKLNAAARVQRDRDAAARSAPGGGL